MSHHARSHWVLNWVDLWNIHVKSHNDFSIYFLKQKIRENVWDCQLLIYFLISRFKGLEIIICKGEKCKFSGKHTAQGIGEEGAMRGVACEVMRGAWLANEEELGHNDLMKKAEGVKVDGSSLQDSDCFWLVFCHLGQHHFSLYFLILPPETSLYICPPIP